MDATQRVKHLQDIIGIGKVQSLFAGCVPMLCAPHYSKSLPIADTLERLERDGFQLEHCSEFDSDFTRIYEATKDGVVFAVYFHHNIYDDAAPFRFFQARIIKVL